MFPRQCRNLLAGADTFDLVAIDHQDVGLFEGRIALFGGNMVFKAAMNGIVLQLVREIVGVRGNVDHGNHIDAFAEKTLVNQRLKYQTSNASEPINRNFNSHSFILYFGKNDVQIRLRNLPSLRAASIKNYYTTAVFAVCIK